MARELAERQLWEFVKITVIGEKIGGRVVRFGAGGENSSPFVVFEPVFMRAANSDKWESYGGAAVNLSTDLGRKVDPKKHVGAFLIFEYVENVPTTKGGTKKVFKVLELEQGEIAALTQKAQKMEKKPSEVRGDAEPEELPF